MDKLGSFLCENGVMKKKEIDLSLAIVRVLTTPLGSRVMRPEFGSRLYELIDRTVDSRFKLDAISATYEAIETNLKEVEIDGVEIEPIKDDSFRVRIGFDQEGSVDVVFE